jgi:hypothetical protein
VGGQEDNATSVRSLIDPQRRHNALQAELLHLLQRLGLRAGNVDYVK